MTFEALIEALNRNLSDIDSSFPPIENVNGAAAVEMDGVSVVLQDAGDLLLMRADLGEVPQDARPELYRAVLEANFLYHGTAGSTIALDPETGRFHMQRYNWFDRLDPSSTLDAIERFAECAASWIALFADYRPPTENTPPADDTPPPFMQMMA